MSEDQLLSAPVPDIGHLCLYNRPEFSALNLTAPQRYERIDYHRDDRLVGSLSGVIDGPNFISGYSSGFGGVDFVRERERLETVMETVAYCVEQLQAAQVRTIAIRAKPLHYGPAEAFLELALLRNGFSREDDNLNFYIDVARYGTAQNYAASLRHAPNRHLRNALACDYDWREAVDGPEWRAAYEVLSQSRQRHGAALSLSFAYLEQMQNVFRSRVRLFGLYKKEVPVAASLVYAITGKSAQVMYWGDSEMRGAADEGKPPVAIMNLVAYRTVEEALKAGFRTLDLGPSTSSKAINFGNCAFKTSIGAQADFRRTYRRDL